MNYYLLYAIKSRKFLPENFYTALKAFMTNLHITLNEFSVHNFIA